MAASPCVNGEGLKVARRSLLRIWFFLIFGAASEQAGGANALSMRQ